MMASLLLAIGGGNSLAQTTENQPLLIQKNSFGEAISDFSTFIGDDNKFTIEAEATAGVEIRLRSKTKGFNYTPKNTGKIRFVRKNSKTFVYEQNVYMGVASECLIFPEITDDNVITSTDNLLANPSFETCGDKIKNDKYKFGDPWISNVTPAEFGIRIGKSSKCNSGSMVLVWRGTKNSNYISQNLSSKIKPNTLYKIALSQVDGGNATADFNVGFGTAKGELDLVSSKVRLGNGLNGKKYVEITTPATIEGDVYFTFKNTSTNTSSSGTDPVTQLDWISVAESLSSTGATSAVYADNVAYAPEEIGDYTSGAIYTEAIENPSFETNNLSPWSSSKTGDTGVKLNSNSNYAINNADGKYIFNTWTGDNNEKYIKQTLSDLPRGYYTVTALVASDAGNAIKIYAGDKFIVAQASTDGKGVGVEYTTPKVRVADGMLEIGATSTSWYKLDNFRLTYYGPYSEFLKEEYSQVKKDGNALLHNEEYSFINGNERATILSLLSSKEPVNDSEYEAAIEKLNTAISTFKSAKTAYDNYAEEVAVAEKFGLKVEAPATAAAATEALKTLNVAEFNAATNDYTTAIKLGEWTTTGASKFSNEHWSGETRSYLNQTDGENPNQGYNSDKWAMTCKQTLTLPAGEYVFKAAGRKSTNAFMKLSVKSGETLVGEVSNFPNGNTGLGITTVGKASFDSNDQFANNNNGWGWQWRFVPFTLDADTEITFEIEAGANAIHNWASFGDYTVMAKPSVAASLTAYNQAVDEAKAALAVEANKVVTGDELTKLNAALEVDKGTTVETIDIATKTIQECTKAFTDATPKYQALVDAKALEQGELAYASKDKYTAFTTSKAATATTAADAEAKANAIIVARRAYVESNGKAEGVKGAVDCTDKLQVTVAGEKMPDVSSDNLGINAGEGATDSEGNKTNKYYDTNGAFWGSDNLKAQMTQNVSGLKSGKYLLTVAARGDASLNNLTLTAGSKSINLPVQTPKNVFGNNWDDYSIETIVDNSGNLNIKIEGKTTKSHAWFSFNNFRLVRLSEAVTLDEDVDNAIEAKEAADVTLKRKFVANKWNTLVLPFAVSDADVKTTFGAEAKVVVYSNADDANINFTTSTKGIEANVPVLIMPAAVNAENTYTFNGVSIVEADPKADGTSYSFVGSYKPYNLVNDDYMLYADKWWKTEAGDTYKIKAFRAYIKANTPAAAKQLNLVIDGQTTGLKLNTVNGNIEGETYNIAGQRVANSYKGLVIKNGKKIIKK